MRGHIYDDKRMVAHVRDNGDVTSDQDGRKLGNVGGDGQLLDLQGRPTGLYLRQLDQPGRITQNTLAKLETFLGG